jgi:hypothetical protein
MERVKITNLQIREKPDINGNYYYVIFNHDELDGGEKKVFFAFPNKAKQNWEVLSSSYDNLKEIEIEYEPNQKGNRVVNIIDHAVYL